MAAAARVYLAERGCDPRQYTLLAFGGAGPVHAWDLARRLKIGRVLCPPAAGAASALGFLVTPPTVDLVTSQVSRVDAFDAEAALRLIAQLEADAAAILAGSGVSRGNITLRLTADMRYVGQGYEIPVPLTADALRNGHVPLKEAFDAEYERVFGRAVADVPAEVLTWRIRASGPEPIEDWTAGAEGGGDVRAARKPSRPAYFGDSDKPLETAVFDRYQLGPGVELVGPAIVEERESTAIVPRGARATVDQQRNLLIDLA
jgi:N-methylhydantoinase A